MGNVVVIMPSRIPALPVIRQSGHTSMWAAYKPARGGNMEIALGCHTIL